MRGRHIRMPFHPFFRREYLRHDGLEAVSPACFAFRFIHRQAPHARCQEEVCDPYMCFPCS
jgi:hypothetical protein